MLKSSPIRCVMVLVVVTIASAESRLDKKVWAMQPVGGIFAESAYNLDRKIYNTPRRARAISPTSRGIAAVRRLLAEAQEVKTASNDFRSYKKAGDKNTALRDFESLSPVVIKRRPNKLNFGRKYNHNNNELVGTVGETRLILWPQGDILSSGSPVLEIRYRLDPLYDRIVYQKPGN